MFVLFLYGFVWFQGDREVVQYDDYAFQVTQFAQQKHENTNSKNNNNFSNEIMLSNIIRDNKMKHEFLSSIPGIFKLIFYTCIYFNFLNLCLNCFCLVWQRSRFGNKKNI